MKTETEKDDPRTSALQWPGKWVRDEAFWRDVVSRSISGVFIAFVVYWGAVIMGYVKTPENMHTAFQVTLGGITVLLSSWWTGKFPLKRFQRWLIPRFYRLPRRAAKVAAYLLAFAVQVACFFFIAAAMTLAVWGIFRIAATILGVKPLF